MDTNTSNTNLRRPDGRTSRGILRPLACELSCLHRADGSALWKAGSTHILAAVYGPIAPLVVHKENQEQGIVSIIIKGGGGGATTTTDSSITHDDSCYYYEYSEFLQQVLSACIDAIQFPRCVIQVVLQVLQSDGSVLGCLLHAAVAALMDAGVDMLYLPIATTCLVVTQPSSSSLQTNYNDNNCNSNIPSTILLDPTVGEELQDNNNDSSSTVVLVTRKEFPGAIQACHTVGPGVSLDELLACIQISAKACLAIPAFFRLAIEQKVTRESQTLWSR